MTGLEFKIYLFSFLAITVPFSIVFGILRAVITCESTAPTLKELVAIFGLCATATYALFLFAKWDDSLEVAWLFAYPIGITLLVVVQVAAILGGTGLIGLLIPPKTRAICPEYYLFTFAGAALLWNDLEKGQNGKLYQLLQALTLTH